MSNTTAAASALIDKLNALKLGQGEGPEPFGHTDAIPLKVFNGLPSFHTDLASGELSDGTPFRAALHINGGCLYFFVDHERTKHLVFALGTRDLVGEVISQIEAALKEPT